MKKTHSITGKDTGMAIHIGLGILLSLVSTIMMSILLTVLVENESVQLSSVPIFAFGMHTVSVLIGCTLSLTLEKGRAGIIAGIVTAGYIAVLLCINMLVFSAGFNGIWGSALSAAGGSLLAMLISGKLRGKKKHRIKVRSR